MSTQTDRQGAAGEDSEGNDDMGVDISSDSATDDESSGTHALPGVAFRADVNVNPAIAIERENDVLDDVDDVDEDTVVVTPADTVSSRSTAPASAPVVPAEDPAVEAEDPAVEAEDPAVEPDDPAVEADATLTRADIRPREDITGPRESAPVDPDGAALVARGLVKQYGGQRAVDAIDLTIPTGAFYGLVGPNGAGKTTTLSMISGLLRPDEGTITIGGIDTAADSLGAKKIIGVLPDRLRTFDRLTGHQLLHYYGVLRGLKPAVVEARAADLARAFDLTSALGRSVSDYSAGMTKKVMLAGALIHSPRVLILDEPFESVDPVSSAVILDILSTYVEGGGTVILSAHGMDLVERVCSRVAFIVGGRVLAEGEVDDVRAGLTLEERFVQLSGGTSEVEGLEWLHTFSD